MTWAIIAIGFLVPVAVGLLTRFQPMIAGFLWPAVVAILTAITLLLMLAAMVGLAWIAFAMAGNPDRV